MSIFDTNKQNYCYQIYSFLINISFNQGIDRDDNIIKSKAKHIKTYIYSIASNQIGTETLYILDEI